MSRATTLARPTCTEEEWLTRARNLGSALLESPVWNDLHEAVDALEQGHWQAVEQWVDVVEKRFFSTWEAYESGDILDEEISTESVLCHRFLMDGTELWLDALSDLREGIGGQIDRGKILGRAEAGQRLLVLVQLLNDEAQESLNRFLNWARN